MWFGWLTWQNLKILLYLLYMYSTHFLKSVWTELTEDKTPFVEFYVARTPLLQYFNLPVTVEVAVVCSKGFADNFNQDRETISEYLSAYFWDMSSRFRTLHENKISFSVTSLTIIKSKEEQPFIENVRDPKDGYTTLEAILPSFQKWISAKSSELNFPGFDVAMLLIERLNLVRESDGIIIRHSVAELKGACDFGTLNNNNDDDDKQGESLFKSAIILPAGLMTSAMYEMAVLLGATRAQKQVCNNTLVSQSQFIKGRKNDVLQFFSMCADMQIKDFIKSPKSSCLHSAQGAPIIDPDFDSVLPPSIAQQCSVILGSKNATAVTTVAGNDCAVTKCQMSGQTSVLIQPLANSRCRLGGDGQGGGRCFHGMCVASGFLLSNVATGKCLIRNQYAQTHFVIQDFKLDHCPRSLAAPSERFSLVAPVKNGLVGNLLKIPCQALTVTPEDQDEVEKFLFGLKVPMFQCGMDMCLSETLHLKKCDETKADLRWEFREKTGSESLLYNVGTQQCLQSSWDITSRNETYLRLSLTKECDSGQPDMLWKLIPVLPENTLDLTPAELRSQLSFQWNSTTENLLNLNVSLTNLDGGVAVAPGVIVSWSSSKSNVTLIEIPRNCFPFPPHSHPSQDGDVVNSLKCKLGRMLQTKNETTLVATLSFNATGADPEIPKRFCATPTMATAFNSGTGKNSQSALSYIC